MIYKKILREKKGNTCFMNHTYLNSKIQKFYTVYNTLSHNVGFSLNEIFTIKVKFIISLVVPWTGRYIFCRIYKVTNSQTLVI